MDANESRERFIGNYPVDLNMLLITPMVFREITPFMVGRSYPTMAILKRLALFSGCSEAAFRTALSRCRKQNVFHEYLDDMNIRRFRFDPTHLELGRSLVERNAQEPGVTVAIGWSGNWDRLERRKLQEVLDWFGFRHFSYNAWMSGWIDIDVLNKVIEEKGLQKHCFFFRTNDLSDPLLMTHIRESFDLENRRRILETFKADTLAFLGEPDISEEEFALRALYYGPVHHRICLLDEPTLPPEVLPKEWPLAEVQGLVGYLYGQRIDSIVAYWESVNGMSGPVFAKVG